MGAFFQKTLREEAFSGTHFKDSVIRMKFSSFYDGVTGRNRGEKVLTELLFWSVKLHRKEYSTFIDF
jgi:hypothetical protein